MRLPGIDRRLAGCCCLMANAATRKATRCRVALTALKTTVLRRSATSSDQPGTSGTVERVLMDTYRHNLVSCLRRHRGRVWVCLPDSERATEVRARGLSGRTAYSQVRVNGARRTQQKSRRCIDVRAQNRRFSPGRGRDLAVKHERRI